MKKMILQNLMLLAALFSLINMLACGGLNVQGIDLGRAVDIGSKALSSNKIPEKEEINMGAQMTAIILGSAPLHPNKELQAYVNKVGAWIAMHSERPKLKWQFAVVDTDAINAFAMPGGYVVVTSGMLDILTNEAELAAILAHEIAHINRKHYLKAMEKAQSLSLVGDVALFAGDVYKAKNPGKADKDFEKKQLVAEKLINTTTELYSKGLERDDEFQADSHAVTLVSRAGYDPYAVAHVLQKLATMRSDDSKLQLLFNSHPKPTDRIKKIERVYSKTKVNSGHLVESRFVSVMNQSGG